MPFLRVGFLLLILSLGAVAAEPKSWQQTLAALRKVKSVDEAKALFENRRADARRFLAQVPPTELMELHDSYIFPVVLLASPIEARAGFLNAMPEWDHGRWRNLEAAAFFAVQRRELTARRWYERGLIAGMQHFDGWQAKRYGDAMTTLATAIDRVAKRGDPISDTLITQIHANLDTLFEKTKASDKVGSAIEYRHPILIATAPALLNLTRRIFELVENHPLENPELHQRLLNDLDRRLEKLGSDPRLVGEEDWILRVGRLRARVKKQKDAINEGMPEGGLLVGGPLVASDRETGPHVTLQMFPDEAGKRPSLRIHDDGEKAIQELEFHLPERMRGAALGMFEPGVWITFPSIDKDHYVYYAPEDMPASFDLKKMQGAEVWLQPWHKAALAASFTATELPDGVLTRETIAAAVSARKAADIIPPPVRLPFARRAGLACRRAAKYLFGDWR